MAEDAKYYFLATNVPASRDVTARLDAVRRDLLPGAKFHADIWWQHQLTAYLDAIPSVWPSFPALFAGRRPPLLSAIVSDSSARLARSVKIAIRSQFNRDKLIKFRQIELAKELSRLFVDLDVDLERSPVRVRISLVEHYRSESSVGHSSVNSRRPGALDLLLRDTALPSRLIIEGGPGQGKSTLTQMLAQVYRQKLLRVAEIDPERRWREPRTYQFPIRLELRNFAEALARDPKLSIDSYIADMLSADGGGVSISPEDVHDIVQNSPTVIIFDGLDEVGSDELRDVILDRISETVSRFEGDLSADLRVIVTSRPPAITGRLDRLPGYSRIQLAPMSSERVSEYLERWLNAQLNDERERERVRRLFASRRAEPHVEALIKNPMQLSVLLHFVYLKDDAFPSRRSDLYQEYFKIVIDRDVEKSRELRREREIVEALHRFLGFRIHTLTEVQASDGTLVRADLLEDVEAWLRSRGDDESKAQRLFRLGEERLGLIIISKGEGNGAYYGFEIQPIREYFAAAHINQDLAVNAHDLFESMVRRPYWREVALFLAGLRRENEKADLLSRTRNLDNDPSLGWRQDGRDIILGLTKEGSLSQPRHVLNDAIDFLLELIDPALVPVKVEPRDYLSALCRLLSVEAGESHRNRVRLLLDRYMVCDDQRLAETIFSVAACVLSDKEYLKKIAIFESRFSHIVTRIKFRITLQHKGADALPWREGSFWEGASEAAWAREIWFTLNQLYSGGRVEVPAVLHPFLLERFAFFEPGRSEEWDFGVTPSTSSLAVWDLLDLSEYLGAYLGSGLRRRRVLEKRKALEERISAALNFQGLAGEYKEAAQDILMALRELFSIIVLGEDLGTRGEILGNYADVLLRYLKMPGVICWLAARCAGPLFPKRAIDYLTEVSPSSADVAVVAINEALKIVRRTPRSRFVRFPRVVRIEEGGALQGINTVVLNALEGSLPAGLDWFLRAPISAGIIRSIFDQVGVTPQILAKLPSLDFRMSDGRPLRTPQLQRVLGIARRSDDPDVLSGCILSISGSRFLKVCGKELALRLLSSRPHGRNLAGMLFKAGRHSYREHDAEIVFDIAKHVVESPADFDVDVVVLATECYSDYFKLNLPPLAGGRELEQMRRR